MNKPVSRAAGWTRSIFLHGKWYVLANLVSKTTIVILLPVYTKYFTPKEYGTLNSLNSIGQLVGIIISLNLEAALCRFYHDTNRSREKLGTLISTLYFFILGWGLLIVGLVLLSSRYWAETLLGVPVWPYIVLAYTPYVYIQLWGLGFHYLRESLKAREATGLLIVYNFTSLALTLVLLLGFGFDIKARLIGNAAAGLINFIIITWMFASKGLLTFKVDFYKFKNWLLFSLPLIPNAAGTWIANFSDRIIISRYDSLFSTGLYGFAVQLAHIIYVLQDSIIQVLLPVSQSGLKHKNAETITTITHFSRLLFVLLLYLCFVLFLFSREMILIIVKMGQGDVSYLESAILVSIIALTYLLTAQYRLFTSIITYHKKTWITSTGGIMMAGTNLALNLIFIPVYGRTAAAYTTVCASLLYTCWIISWACRLENIKLKYGFYIFMSILYSISITAINLFFPGLLDFSWLHVAIKVAVCLAILAVFFLSRKYWNKTGTGT
ncbi:MAG: hypothetical protein B0D92_06075 [Spirochaeta sp. LUC14_002_19_P3]|nr:MAG: hypothetical protein B0D92_06075 [Spirochaeta sp. LUC14_002_19_P3]